VARSLTGSWDAWGVDADPHWGRQRCRQRRSSITARTRRLRKGANEILRPAESTRGQAQVTKGGRGDESPRKLQGHPAPRVSLAIVDSLSRAIRSELAQRTDNSAGRDCRRGPGFAEPGPLDGLRSMLPAAELRPPFDQIPAGAPASLHRPGR